MVLDSGGVFVGCLDYYVYFGGVGGFVLVESCRGSFFDLGGNGVY